MDTEVTIPGLGDAYFDPDHKVNIMSLGKATEDNFVEMKSWEDDCFRVQPKKFGKNGKPDHTKPHTEFRKSDEGLYGMMPSDKYVNTIDQHKKNPKITGVQEQKHTKITGVQGFAKSNDSTPIDSHVTGTRPKTEMVLRQEIVVEHNFLTHVDETVTPEDVMEYQLVCFDKQRSYLVETLSKNRKFYTMREFKTAKRARALCHDAG